MMRRMIYRLLLSIACIVLVSASPLIGQEHKWQLVYSHDAEGHPTEGDLEALKNAVREGHEVRIYFSSKRDAQDQRWVEHSAEATFLTIMSDTLVAGQIRPIVGQTPDFGQMSIALKENLSWSMLASTSGLCDTMMRQVVTGAVISHSQQRFALRWFARP